MSYLSFNKIGTAESYAIGNSSDEIIGFIERVRNGQWMHWSFVITPALMKECIENEQALTYSPGCQDEIREFCKQLNSQKEQKESKTK